MNLRPYQLTAIENVMASINDAPVILCGPVGSGKTRMAVEICQRLNLKTVWIAHRRELIYQAAQAIENAGGECGIILPGEPHTDHQIQVASVQTLARRGMPDCDLLVVDECSHMAASSYQTLQAPLMLGLTATPYRLDGRGLRPPFQSIVTAASVQELVDQGYLVDPEVYAPPSPDLTGIRKRAGDYANDQLATRMSTPKLVGNIVEHWLKLTPNRKTVVFAVNINHSKMITQQFVDAGVRAEHLDGTSTDRDEVLARLKSGETTVVSNCNLLIEGWDLPSLEVAVMARPTASLSFHLQSLGRIMRSCPEKLGATVLDHSGNHERHGTVTQVIPYSLDGITKQSKPAYHGLGRCPVCYMLLPSDWTLCPGCGATRPEPKIPKHVDGNLELWKTTDFYKQADYWDALEKRRIESGYKEGWSLFRFKHKYGIIPTIRDGKLCRHDDQRSVYLGLLAKARSKGWKAGWAAIMFQKRFGHWPSSHVKGLSMILTLILSSFKRS